MATAIATAMATATAMAAQHKEINFFNVYKLTGSCMVSGVYSNTFIFTSTQDTKQLYENFASSSPMKQVPRGYIRCDYFIVTYHIIGYDVI